MAHDVTISKDATSGQIEVIAGRTGDTLYGACYPYNKYNGVSIINGGGTVQISFVNTPYLINPDVDNVTIGSATYNAGTKTAAEIYALLKASDIFYPL